MRAVLAVSTALWAAVMSSGVALAGVRADADAELRVRWAQMHTGSDETDQDLGVTLGLEAEGLARKGLGFSGRLYYAADLDGTAESSVYKDALDTYSRRDDWRLYRAVLSYDLPAGRGRIEGGRQEVWSAETVLFDGALVRVVPSRWAQIEVFGGRRVSFFKDPEPNAVYGANVKLRPWPGGAFAVEDVRYIKNSLELEWIQDLAGWGTGRLTYRMIDRDPERATAAFHVYPWAQAEFHARYERTFSGQGDDAFAYDYTSAEEHEVSYLTFEPLEPYSDYRIAFRQGFLGKAGIGLQIRHHNVIDKADEDTYNVDFDEGAVLLDLSDVPWAGLRADARVFRWVENRDRSDITEDHLWGFSVGLEQGWRGHAVGAGFERTAYDSDGRPRDSRVVEVWARIHLWSRADLHVRYARQSDDLYRSEGVDALHTFAARLNLSF